ncbi:ribulokinase [Actinorhabdospora filicis]|uniref:Ribulokinase n=1 Tax=Actinorhabdospora filicis TaxID=1785913 RepID=A0A9W6SLX4_9ACTN|nr:ribulokinase [Actinorhabdospora filicis]GLZ78226.1 ribulokinase [Actinorhabdospora filicis]
MTHDRYVVGVDFGTLSARALVVRVADGAEVGTAVSDYAHGVIDRVLPATGRALPPDWALQDPRDYLDALRTCVPAAITDAGIDPAAVIGIATDFTASTVLPTLADGTPLSLLPDYADRPHAYAKLWKHHAAHHQADRINALAEQRREPWLARYGGTISPAWQLAKGLQLLEEDPELYARAERWIEAGDWIVWQLTGSESRGVSAAGYKGTHQDGARPSTDFLAALHPGFADVAAKLAHPLTPQGTRAGGLSSRAAAWTGLPAGIAVAVGSIDAHATMPAAQALTPGRMAVIMGTSSCHLMNAERPADVRGMCGVVDGGIVPGAWGYEAGQSAVGDIFAWFTDTAMPASYTQDAARLGRTSHEHLSALAAGQRVGEHGLLALDWHNGNRSVLADHELSGIIVGLTLATRPEDVYRALLEATAFGTRTIIEAFEDAGVAVRDLVIAGGLARNPLLMGIYADVTGRPLSLIASEQGSALGAAIHAAVAAGAYPDLHAASAAMGGVHANAYLPDPARAAAYDALYAEYRRLHDHFGRGGSDVLHRLRWIRNAAVSGA